MKDYSFGKEEAKTFILKYEIDGDNMIVYYANKKIDVIPYNKANEVKVLSKMRDQVYDSEKRFSKTRYNIKICVIIGIIQVICRLFIQDSLLIALLVSCVVSSIALIPLAIKYSDYHKNRLFLKNDMTLNDHLKTNPNVLSNTKLNTKEFEVALSSKKIVFDINNIDKVSYRDLKIMLENIKRSQDMGYVYSEYEDVNDQKKEKIKGLK